ncbi:hypothetical protein Q8F55_001154 [Vanrija albida]|uniref:Gamma interferon inducible lysosomal thiol reductase GILT n=1 Tax=Vanrija albida TaxID=181172 RepID=A0ABR3QFY7_9TREE
MLATTWTLLATLVAAGGVAARNEQIPLLSGYTGNDGSRVPVRLHVMSRCPDARRCEAVFEEVVKTEGIDDKIDLTLGMLGKLNPEAEYGVECMHGDLECAGDAHQLCLVENLPLAQWYAVLSCMNFGHFPGAIGQLAFTRKCVEASGVDWWGSGVGRCIQGRHPERSALVDKHDPEQPVAAINSTDEAWAYEPENEGLGRRARRLLRDSVNQTVSDGIKKSCTIRITSTLSTRYRDCVVDGGVWKGCNDGHEAVDFVKAINEEHDNLARLKRIAIPAWWTLQ